MKHIVVQSKNVICFLFILFICGCVNKKYSKQDYIKFVLSNESGLSATQTFDGIKYNLQYLPTTFMVITENKEITTDSIKKAEENYNSLEYFKLTLSAINDEKKSKFYFIQNPTEYNRFLQYVNSEFNSSVKLYSGDEKIDCVMSYCETGYRISPKLIFILGFTKPFKVENFKISFEDKIFENGIVNFLIERSDIENVKGIKIS